MNGWIPKQITRVVVVLGTGMNVKRVRQAVSPGDVKRLKEACFSKATTQAHRTVSSVCVCVCVCV
jgi:hypothetical protein